MIKKLKVINDEDYISNYTVETIGLLGIFGVSFNYSFVFN